MKEIDNLVGGNDSTSRRQFLRAAGGATSLALTAPFVVNSAGADDTGLPDEFAVEGHEIIRTEITPEEITVHERKVSPDLKQRYGKASVETTETVERPGPDEDDLPARDVRVERRPWETHYATEDEWRAFHTHNQREVETRAAGVTALDQNDAESNYPYGVWTYKEVDGGYETGSPINLISTETIYDVKMALYACDGWDIGWIAEYTRYAWNSDSEQFESQHDSAATGTYGFLGRNHLRMWEFGGYVSLQGHLDSSAPHEATSYLESEREVEQIFDDCYGWTSHRDHYDLPNCCKMDHNGYATLLSG